MAVESGWGFATQGTVSGGRVVLARTLFTVPKGAFASVSSRVERKMQEAVFQVGRQVRDMARKNAPKKTGALRASIYVSKGAVDRSEGAARHIGGNAFTKQSTLTYFRAVNAAIKRNPFREPGNTRGLALLDPDVGGSWGPGGRNTQRPLKAVAEEFNRSISLIDGHNYDSFNMSEGAGRRYTDEESGNELIQGNEAIMPSVMQLGGAGRTSFFCTVGAAAYYAGYVEFGHMNKYRFVAPQPFLGPAVEWGKPVLEAELARIVNESAREAAAKA